MRLLKTLPAALALAETRGSSGAQLLKAVLAGLDLLAELGHLEAWQEPTRTKPRTLYIVNPKSAPPAGVRR